MNRFTQPNNKPFLYWYEAARNARPDATTAQIERAAYMACCAPTFGSAATVLGMALEGIT